MKIKVKEILKVSIRSDKAIVYSFPIQVVMKQKKDGKDGMDWWIFGRIPKVIWTAKQNTKLVGIFVSVPKMLKVFNLKEISLRTSQFPVLLYGGEKITIKLPRIVLAIYPTNLFGGYAR